MYNMYQSREQAVQLLFKKIFQYVALIENGHIEVKKVLKTGKIGIKSYFNFASIENTNEISLLDFPLIWFIYLIFSYSNTSFLKRFVHFCFQIFVSLQSKRNFVYRTHFSSEPILVYRAQYIERTIVPSPYSYTLVLSPYSYIERTIV